MARLSGLDVAFLCLETRTRPMHMGAIGVFRASGPVDRAGLVELLASRAAATPLLRRSVRPVWFPPGAAQWREEELFDAAAHVHGYEVADRRTFEAYASRLDGHAAGPVAAAVGRPRGDRPARR